MARRIIAPTLAVFLGLFLMSQSIRASINNAPILLQSKLLKTVDGRFINATIIEIMRKFQRKVLDIMIGDQDQTGKRIGRYQLDGVRYGAYSLTRHEEQFKKAQDASDVRVQDLQRLLRESKRDFMAIAGEFRVVVRGSKSIVAALVEESCTRRGRPGSLLCVWAKTKEADEDVLFDSHVKTFGEFTLFCSDLLNFLNDLVNSCPRANALFVERVERWKKIRECMTAIAGEVPVVKEAAFSLYVRKNYLDNLSLAEITPDRLKSIARAYKSHAA